MSFDFGFFSDRSQIPFFVSYGLLNTFIINSVLHGSVITSLGEVGAGRIAGRLLATFCHLETFRLFLLVLENGCAH